MLINDVNLIGEILSDKLMDFYTWYEVQKNKLSKLENPAAVLLYYLCMTPKQGFHSRAWKFINTDEPPKQKQDNDHSELYFLQWKQVCDELSALISPSDLNTWFLPLSIAGITDNNPKTVILKVPSEFVYEKIEGDFIEPLSIALKKVFGNSIEVRYQIPRV